MSHAHAVMLDIDPFGEITAGDSPQRELGVRDLRVSSVRHGAVDRAALAPGAAGE